VDVDVDGHPVAAWIWGHRFRIGQHWMEYLLEFLNVLAGFDYKLGQGLDSYNGSDNYLQTYTRFSRLGLRRFIFYDDHEKTKHPYDDRAIELLWQALQQNAISERYAGDKEPLTLARNLLHAFSAIEDARSWYAKSLFPAHHNLLFWEALRRGATKYRGKHVSDNTPLGELDVDISYNDRNFFARGGEIYYLILSAGTELDPDRRTFICKRVHDLLTGQNKALGSLASIIDRNWQRLQDAEADTGSIEGTDKRAGAGRLGWIPYQACQLNRFIAEDVSILLQNDLDTLGSLDLLSHLIGFHLVQHIYHHASSGTPETLHASGACQDTARPLLLVDALPDASVIRNLSRASFREQEYHQEQRATAYIRTQVRTWAQELTGKPHFGESLVNRAERHFSLNSLHGVTRKPYQEAVDSTLAGLSSGDKGKETFVARYSDILIGVLWGDFRRNFLGVHRKLSKRIGFVAPRTGPSGRFVLGDNLLKTLVLANVPPDTQIPFGEFLERMYERYGLVVGPGEAYKSGLFDRQRINAEYYGYNRAALLAKMKHAGLVLEYSDATALVINRETPVGEDAGVS